MWVLVGQCAPFARMLSPCCNLQPWGTCVRHNHLHEDFCQRAHLSVSGRRVMVLREITATPDLQMCSLLGGTGASLHLLMSL